MRAGSACLEYFGEGDKGDTLIRGIGMGDIVGDVCGRIPGPKPVNPELAPGIGRSGDRMHVCRLVDTHGIGPGFAL